MADSTTKLKKHGGNLRNKTAKANNAERRAVRRKHAEERQAFCAALSRTERLRRLDARLGKDVGAKRERAALSKSG